MPRATGVISLPVFVEGPLGDVLGQIGAPFQLRQNQQNPDKVAELLLAEILGIDL